MSIKSDSILMLYRISKWIIYFTNPHLKERSYPLKVLILCNIANLNGGKSLWQKIVPLSINRKWVPRIVDLLWGVAIKRLVWGNYLSSLGTKRRWIHPRTSRLRSRLRSDVLSSNNNQKDAKEYFDSSIMAPYACGLKNRGRDFPIKLKALSNYSQENIL